MNYLPDPELENYPEYKKVLAVIEMLSNANMLRTFNGSCIAASDIIVTALAQVGIESVPVECQMVFSLPGPDPEQRKFMFVGYDSITFPGEVDTHVVVVTKTRIPMIIDASIGHLLPNNFPVIVGRIDKDTPQDKIAELNIKGAEFNYMQKKNLRLPTLHQKTLLDRLREEYKIKNSIQLLKKIVLAIALIGTVNFVLNTTLITLKILNP